MIRWGVLTRVSNDKGPYKIATFQADGKDVIATIIEASSVQTNPIEGSLALLFYPDGDEGRAVAIVGPPPAKRTDQQKAGEASFVSHDTGNSIQHQQNGDTVVKTAGVFHVNPPG